MPTAELNGDGIASMVDQHQKTLAGKFVGMDLTLGFGHVMMEI